MQETEKTGHHMEASEIDSIKQNDSSKTNISVMYIVKVIKPLLEDKESQTGFKKKYMLI